MLFIVVVVHIYITTWDTLHFVTTNLLFFRAYMGRYTLTFIYLFPSIFYGRVQNAS